MKNILTVILFGISLVLSSQTTLFSEDFEGTTSVTSYTASGSSGSWSINNNLSVSGTKSDSAVVILSDTIFLETSTINATGYVFLSLDFKQICKIDFFDAGIIQVSSNNGATWTTLSSSEYNGSGFLNGNAFSSVSYTNWDATIATAIPQSSWWQAENFDLSSIGANSSQLKIRFGLIDSDNNGARSNYGWLIDDIVVSGGACELISPSISLTGTIYQGVVYTAGPYTVQADIQDASGVASASLSYSINGGTPIVNAMSNISGNIYEYTIGGIVIGDTVCYSVTGVDATTCGNVGVFPISGCTEFIVRNSPPATCIGAPVGTFNYSESFGGFTSGTGTNANPGVLTNNWENDATGDSHDWYVLDQSTTSTQTGPSADHSALDATFLYVEATGQFNQTAILNTPCYDLTGLLAPEFSFWYHMYGNTMGDLHVDVFFGNQWVLDVIPVISGDQGDQWYKQYIDLSTYTGSVIKLRFRALTGANFRSDIAIDDIEIIEPTPFDVEVNSLISPNSSGCSGSANEFLTINLSNLGSNTLSEIPLAYTVNGGSIVRDTARFNLMSGGSANHTFQQSINMSTSGNYSIDIWSELPMDGEISNDSILNNVVSTSIIATNFPDTTNFDLFSVGVPGTFLDGWSNDQLDAHDWYVNSNGTTSPQTGPSGDNTSGSGNYLYVEATGFNNLEAGIVSKCYDISNLNSPELTFFYNMNGLDMGELHLDLIINGFKINDIINPVSGDQGVNWKQQIVDLTPFKGVVKLIFRGITGAGYRSDIAIDDISIRDAMPVGIRENENEFNFGLYPNPVLNEMVILSDALVNQLEILDIAGKVMYKKVKVHSNHFISNVSQIPSGIYIVRVYSNLGVKTKKVVIE